MARAGTLIDNYTLIKRLGINSFGEVWSARESITERLVSINFLSSSDEFEIARFTRAISLLSRLNHPAIAVHTGHGFHERRPYLATEHLQGPTLATLSGQGGRMDELRVLQMAVQIADALDHAWTKAKVIHRNLGPQSILIDLASIQSEYESVSIRIIDFGHALGNRLIDTHDPEQVAEEAAFQQAAQHERVGTPLTLSPEQITGARLTVGADMYALGVTMYQLLTGAPPFSGIEQELLVAHQKAIPRDLQQLLPGLQPGTAALIKRLLAKTPAGRFQDWAICRDKLAQQLSQLEGRRPAPPVAKSTPSTASFRRTETFDRTPVGKAIPSREPVPDYISHVPHPAGQNPLSAEDLRTLADHARNLRANSLTPAIGSAQLSPAAQAQAGALPEVEDGLTPDQRRAVWAFLFRTPALLNASLSQAVEQAAPAPASRRETAAPEDGESGIRPIHRPSEDSDPTITEVPTNSDETEFDEDLDPSDDSPATYAELFALPPAEQDDQHRAAGGTPNPFNSDVPCNPLISRSWKPAIEILREAILGTSRSRPAVSDGISKRFTRSLLRMVASRESTIIEIGTLIDAGNFAEAESLLDRTATTVGKNGTVGNDPELCLLRARLLAMRGDFAAAISWAQRAVQQSSPDPLALGMVGLCHLMLKRVKIAIAVFDELARVHPQSPLGPLGQGTILFLAGFDSKADTAFNDSAERQIIPSLYRMGALRYRASGDAENEIACLEKLLTGTTADWAIRERLVELTGAKGDSSLRVKAPSR